MSASTGTLALSLGLCLCAGQLMGPSPANAAPIALKAAAVATAKVTPKLTNTYSKRTVTKGGAVKVTAKLIDPKTGKVITTGLVRLQVWKNGKFVNVTSKAISKTGRTELWNWPKTSTTYRTAVGAHGKYHWAASSNVRVTVRTPANAGAKILAEAKRHTGALYKFAASGPSRFDCSGYTMYVYKKAVGKSLPHKANSQQKYGKAVSKASKKAGDLIVFRNGSYGYHAGIYAGGGYMYDSPHTGARVGKHKIYGSNYVVRRLAA
jgi:cell wall-associated NlpC family hydrolase